MTNFQDPGYQESPVHPSAPPHIIGEPQPKGSFFERILNPQALQRMMAVGGGLLVLGLIGWLWSMGVFDNPIVVATALGAATIATIGIGGLLVRFTRYQLAGFGITLLGVLAMPLNLWLYDAQGLITLSEGGHLWIPATICCGIYAIVARVLKKPIFVYTLVGGVVMTGMLFLADQSVGRFSELMAPVIFLVLVGWVCIIAEQFFESGKGAFSKEEFGLAFYRAGMGALSIGLSLLLFSQTMYALEWFANYGVVRFLAGHASSSQLWATGLLAGSSVGFGVLARYRGDRVRLALNAAGLGIWAIVCGFDYLNIQLQVPHAVIALGILILVRHCVPVVRHEPNENKKPIESFLHWLPMFAIIPLAAAQFIALFVENREMLLFAPPSLIVVAQMLMSAAVCWILTRTNDQNVSRIGDSDKAVSLSLSGSFLALAAISTGMLIPSATLATFAAIGLVIPLVLAFQQRTWLNPHQNSIIPSTAATSVVTLIVVLLAMGFAPMGLVAHAGTWTWLLGLAGLICLIGSRHNVTDRILGHVAIAGAFWSLATLANIAPEFALPVAITVAGSVMAIIALIKRVAQSSNETSLRSNSIEVVAHSYIAAGSVMGILLCLSRLVGGEVLWSHAGLLAAQLASIGLASVLTNDRKWRSAFRPLAIANAVALLFVINSGLDVSIVNRLEIMMLAAGAILIAAGHAAWYREGDQEDDMATISLWLGSLMLALPLAIGVVAHRLFIFDIGSPWELFHTWGALIAAISLLCAGVTCRIRATTFSGSGLLIVFVAALIGWPEQLTSVSVAMMAGGGLFFAIAVLLSIYRDRIVQLPEKIREGRGVFSVMRWR